MCWNIIELGKCSEKVTEPQCGKLGLQTRRRLFLAAALAAHEIAPFNAADRRMRPEYQVCPFLNRARPYLSIPLPEEIFTAGSLSKG